MKNHRIATSLIGLSFAVAQLAVSSTAIAGARPHDKPSDKHSYEIDFVSKGNSWHGHGYVMWKDTDVNTGHVSETAAGYYEEQNRGRYEFSDSDPTGPGGLESENFQLDSDRGEIAKVVEVPVSERQWAASIAMRQAYSMVRPAYALGISDCVTFMQRVAGSIGLEAPRSLRNATPVRYVEALEPIVKARKAAAQQGAAPHRAASAQHAASSSSSHDNAGRGGGPGRADSVGASRSAPEHPAVEHPAVEHPAVEHPAPERPEPADVGPARLP